MNLDQVRKSLNDAGIIIPQEKRNSNNDGFRIECENGAIVNIYDTGTVNVQGKNTTAIKVALGLESQVQTGTTRALTAPMKPKIFVVYGHDRNAINELEAMLRRWELEPMILDALPSAGATVIEKLENYCQENSVSFAVVLATPDDVGYPKEDEGRKRPRTRQNVVLELGMVLGKLGRKKVAILRPPKEQMEAPSDIDGLLYLEYTTSISDCRAGLAREIEGAIPGFSVRASQL